MSLTVYTLQLPKITMENIQEFPPTSFSFFSIFMVHIFRENLYYWKYLNMIFSTTLTTKRRKSSNVLKPK